MINILINCFSKQDETRQMNELLDTLKEAGVNVKYVKPERAIIETDNCYIRFAKWDPVKLAGIRADLAFGYDKEATVRITRTEYGMTTSMSTNPVKAILLIEKACNHSLEIDVPVIKSYNIDGRKYP